MKIALGKYLVLLDCNRLDEYNLITTASRRWLNIDTAFIIIFNIGVFTANIYFVILLTRVI